MLSEEPAEQAATEEPAVKHDPLFVAGPAADGGVEADVGGTELQQPVYTRLTVPAMEKEPYVLEVFADNIEARLLAVAPPADGDDDEPAEPSDDQVARAATYRTRQAELDGAIAEVGPNLT